MVARFSFGGVKSGKSRLGEVDVSADKTSVVSADKTSVVSADKSFTMIFEQGSETQCFASISSRAQRPLVFTRVSRSAALEASVFIVFSSKAQRPWVFTRLSRPKGSRNLGFYDFLKAQRKGKSQRFYRYTRTSY